MSDLPNYARESILEEWREITEDEEKTTQAVRDWTAMEQMFGSDGWQGFRALLLGLRERAVITLKTEAVEARLRMAQGTLQTLDEMLSIETLVLAQKAASLERAEEIEARKKRFVEQT